MTYKEELFATPERIIRAIDEDVQPELVTASHLVFCGCGTSYYLGAQCAAICRNAGREANAVDAIDLISHHTLPRTDCTYIFISRSGNSDETVRAASLVAQSGAYTFYLGCTAQSRLDNICAASRILLYGNETLVLESYSYYIQMIAALRCCGITLDNKLPGLVRKALECGEQRFSEWLKHREISRIISLSSPFYRPLHREMMLKDGEITQLPREEWGILEFRHGPRCWCDETTLIHVVSEQATRDWDTKVAKELIGYGCPVIWYGDDAPEGCYQISFDIPHRSAEETLLFGAFHTCLAVEIGRERNTTPENLRYVVHNVGDI